MALEDNQTTMSTLTETTKTKTIAQNEHNSMPYKNS
ncbi:hypothetical protein KR100_02800 [Synechococcus sp. KORDI-100]|nr:hypothetical protein KR100_02800 [Synechococcus sp. KORDI-100]